MGHLSCCTGRGRWNCTFDCAFLWCWHGEWEFRTVRVCVMWCVTGCACVVGILSEFNVLIYCFYLSMFGAVISLFFVVGGGYSVT